MDSIYNEDLKLDKNRYKLDIICNKHINLDKKQISYIIDIKLDKNQVVYMIFKYNVR